MVIQITSLTPREMTAGTTRLETTGFWTSVSRTIESRTIKAKTIKLIAMLVLTLSALLNLQSVSAEPRAARYYDIEVIIFDDADEKYLHSEHWPQKPETTTAPLQEEETAYPIISSLSKTETGSDTATNDSDLFQNIEPSILTDEAKRISNSRHYHMLFYAAWTQEGLDSKHAISINLKQLNNHANVRTKNTITGELKIVLARYLHFYSELEYIPEHKVRTVEQVPMRNQADEKHDNNEAAINEETMMKRIYRSLKRKSK